MFNFYRILLIILLILVYYYYTNFMEALKMIEKYENNGLDDSEKELKKFREEKENINLLNLVDNNSQYIKILSKMI